jgi:hypothetical protein
MYQLQLLAPVDHSQLAQLLSLWSLYPIESKELFHSRWGYLTAQEFASLRRQQLPE